MESDYESSHKNVSTENQEKVSVVNVGFLDKDFSNNSAKKAKRFMFVGNLVDFVQVYIDDY